MKRRFFFGLIFCVSVTLAQNKDLIAVIDLENDGGVLQSDISAIGDAIVRYVERDGRYFMFDRQLIGPVLEETGISKTRTCSHEQCLATIGSVLGAKKIIGGRIERDNGRYSIKLIKVDVASASIENSVLLEKKTSHQNLLDVHLPRTVMALLAGGVSKGRESVRETKRARWWLPVTGILAIGAAGAAAYLYLEQQNDEKSEAVDNEIPMDDVPVRTR